MARVLVAGTYDQGFNRNIRVQRLLLLGGHEVATCNVELWGGERHEIPAGGKLRTVAKALVAYPRLIWRFLREPRADLVLVGYPGWFDVIVLAPLARLKRMPVLFDPFISLYDTTVTDRRLVSPRSPVAWLAKLVDRFSIRWATHVLADTPQHAEYYATLAGVAPGRLSVVWVGANDALFVPQLDVVEVPGRVMFHGTLIGLQGVETILRAAKLLEPDGVEVRIIGTGQQQPLVDRLMDELQPTNVQLVGQVPLEALPGEIAHAAVCLGIFGTSDKAARVVPNKVFEYAAVGRPVITADTPAVRAAFPDDELELVPAGDHEALAAAVRRVLADPARRGAMAAAARHTYAERFASEPSSRLLDAAVARAIDHFRPE